MNPKLVKILKGLGIALGGAALTWATEQIPHIQLGTSTPLVVACYSALINIGKIWLQQEGVDK